MVMKTQRCNSNLPYFYPMTRCVEATQHADEHKEEEEGEEVGIPKQLPEVPPD
jgi:hypothetical protein